MFLCLNVFKFFPVFRFLVFFCVSVFYVFVCLWLVFKAFKFLCVYALGVEFFMCLCKIATFRVARLTLQTRKMVSRRTETPPSRCPSPQKKRKKKKEKKKKEEKKKNQKRTDKFNKINKIKKSKNQKKIKKSKKKTTQKIKKEKNRPRGTSSLPLLLPDGSKKLILKRNVKK